MVTSSEENRRKNAEKQRKYRELHLKVECDKVRLQCNVTTGSKCNLDRLARYYGYSVTELLEKLIDAETNKVLTSLSADDQNKFFDFELQRNHDDK